MATFPILSKNPVYPLEESYLDNTLRSNFEAGYELTRPRYTRLRRIFNVRYTFLPEADKTALESFYQTVGCYDSFTWTHPGTGESITVRFVAPPKFSEVQYGRWNVEFQLREV